MDLKKIEEYNQREKEELLNHWFHYYGKEIYSLEELMDFQKLIEKDSKTILEVAIICYANGNGPSFLLHKMRENKIEEMIDRFKIKARELQQQFSKEYQDSVNSFLEEVVTTYNNPEPDIPLPVEELAKQLANLKNNHYSLKADRVETIFADCLFKEEEMKDNKPTEDFTISEGVGKTALFSTKRLNKNKREIVSMIREIKDIDLGPYFLNMCVRQDDSLWTSDHTIVDDLLMLGLATETLSIPFQIPREEWTSMFPEGLPYVLQNKENFSTPVVGNSPKSYGNFTKKLNR